jgi:selenocysteine-specific elongation factor
MMAQPRLSKPAFGAALQKLARAGEIVLDGAFVRLPSHVVRLSPEDRAVWKVIATLIGADARFRPPRVRDITAAAGFSEHDVRRVLKLAGRMGWTDEVAHDHFFLRSTVREMAAIASDLSESGGRRAFSAGEFRDRMDNGRKVAIQILDGGPEDADGGETSPVGRPDFKSVWGSEPVSGGFDSHSLPPAPAVS